jgi:hypothetical protein
MSEGMMDIIKISPELAETLPFYKTRTRSFEGAQFLLEKVEIHRGCDDSKCYIPETVPLEWHFHFAALERERVPADLQRKLQ